MFNLTNEILLRDSPIDIPVGAGGVVFFEGRVRNLNNGRNVLKLQYESFEEMAIKQGNIILELAKKKFKIYDAFCVHRVGELELGEIAIFVGAFAQHRKPAFEAVSFIVDEIKTKVPIWKKEFYVDGQTDWVKCLECAAKGIGHHDHFHHV